MRFLLTLILVVLLAQTALFYHGLFVFPYEYNEEPETEEVRKYA